MARPDARRLAAAQSYFHALSKRMSGYAANFGDPDAYALGMLTIKEIELSTFSLIEQPAFYWTHDAHMYADDCVEQPEDSPATATAAADPASPGACAVGLKRMSFSSSIGPVKLSVSCDTVSASAKWEAMPWLQGFADVSYDVRAGKLSVVAGAKGDASIGLASGSFKSGIYLTADDNGIKDVGWRVGPSATVAAGPIKIASFSDEMDLSFVGAVSSTFGL